MSFQKFKKTIKRPLLLTLALLLLAVLGFYVAYKKSTKDKEAYRRSAPCQLETALPSNEIPSQTKTGQSLNQYTNYEAYFGLNYPVDLELHEVRRSGCINQNAGYTRGYPSALWLIGRFSEAQKYGQIGICAGDADFKNDGCAGGGISILYGVPEINGKGGGCSKDYRTILVGGQEADGCFTEEGFSVGYPGHPQGLSELTILAIYSERFSEETAMEVLGSLRFVDKN